MTSKLYPPRLASGPCPGTEINMPSHSLESGVNFKVSRMPSGVVTTRLGGTEVSSPVKHSTCSTNLWIVKTVPELPAAILMHGCGTSELLNRPAITEFGRYGREGWVVAGWVGLRDREVTFWDGVPGAEVTDWGWLGDPGSAAECDVLAESDGAG